MSEIEAGSIRKDQIEQDAALRALKRNILIGPPWETTATVSSG